MIITLDVSAAIEFIMGRKYQPFIKSKLEKADWIIAPTLFIYEASNVMWKYHSIKNYPQDKLLRKLRQILNIIDQFVEPKNIYEEAISVSFKIDHPVYDAMYLVTSRRKNAKLLTMDNRLIKAASKLEIPVYDFN
ncbi:type II toxin-antitoxin system VapC family toxin [Halothermothrix orenii]|uniref:Predicted nucleic acid-binding protein, contains PIN domain n=1 Tax=Halothermothrix orenii (strain H 168 / OCM 544 / DSM 9562) TaxID=373903 RepID=B8D039_HALOH|nr:type II toxin-antitoxin system VapC family toxin [Halothermothrix orenii]ACL68793.1 predicted nucleic acid-binding protein, contains PIN domain [Halothermothrix orenii H 168]